MRVSVEDNRCTIKCYGCQVRLPSQRQMAPLNQRVICSKEVRVTFTSISIKVPQYSTWARYSLSMTVTSTSRKLGRSKYFFSTSLAAQPTFALFP